jgi:hypothetical protein
VNSANFTERPGVAPSIKANPGTSFSRSLMLICVLGMAIIGIVDLVRPGRGIFPGIFYIAYACLMICLYFLQRRQAGKLDQRRQLAASGDQSLLAREQIVPNEVALPLPTTLKMRSNWLGFVAITAILMLIMVVIVAISYILVVGANPHPFHMFLTYLVLELPILLIPLIAVLLIFFLRRRRGIEVSENGLTLYDVSGAHYVPWNEARLFAIYMGKKDAPAISYELASAKDIVRWTWLRKFSKFNTELPTTSIEEYNRQMQPLLALIAARIGLPLYDLR